MIVEDQVQVRCTRCKNVFRERAARLQDGFSRQCPSCEAVIFFNEGTADPNIRRALREAREMNKRIRALEHERLERRAVSSLPRRFSGESAAVTDDDVVQ